MASGKSAYFENKVLDIFLGNTTWSGLSTLYLALSTSAWSASSTGSSMSEVSTSGTAYARVAVTNNSTNWPAASAGSKSNGTVFTFPTATASWGTAVSMYVVDASSAGNILYGADLTASRAVGTGDTASFASSAITVTEA